MIFGSSSVQSLGSNQPEIKTKTGTETKVEQEILDDHHVSTLSTLYHKYGTKPYISCLIDEQFNAYSDEEECFLVTRRKRYCKRGYVYRYVWNLPNPLVAKASGPVVVAYVISGEVKRVFPKGA